MSQTYIKIGIDEAGRGPWFWPVVAAALAFHPIHSIPDSLLRRLQDSKVLSESVREELFSELIHYAQWEEPQIFFWVWVVDSQMIDAMNIKQANKEAMRRALIEIQRKIPKEFEIRSVVIDWNDNYTFQELSIKPISIIEWDRKVSEISGASILAKVFRDKLMDTYSLLYPALWVDSNKWYGTKKHQTVLQWPKDVTWAHRLTFAPIVRALSRKPKLLLHVCCGPDATVPIMDLKGEYDLLCYWYDPNIQPKKEYTKRLRAFQKVCEQEWVEWIEGEYDVERFLSVIRWLEHTPEKWEKCTQCYDMRLERSAQIAKEHGIKLFTSTLNNSPHKDMLKMYALGDKYAEEYGLRFLKIPFRKNDGFNRSVAYTKLYDIYRQNYCGCIYSDTFPGKNKKKTSNDWDESNWCG